VAVSPLLAVGHGNTSMWYLTRATGVVSLVLLTGTVVLGITSTIGWATEHWPRFLWQDLHRNLSLFAVVLVGVHVVTTVADGYVPITLLDAVVPFHTAYRPLWVGLGALAFDMLLAVLITSGLRRRVGRSVWRRVHWLAYLCWPIALLHGLGSGTDSRLGPVVLVEALCVLAVTGALLWRLAAGRVAPWRRLAALGGAVVVLVGVVAFAAAGPLRSGWARRAGTSPALLHQLAVAAGTAPAATASASQGSTPTAPSSSSPASGAPVPQAPFETALSGTYQTSKPDGAGNVTVTISTTLQGTGTPLVVQLTGTPVGGGVAMSSSQVTLGADTGTVTALSGTDISAVVSGNAGALRLVISLQLDQASNAVTGTVSGRASGGGEGGQ
jgi:sulfoxide reductase heme-binding subunit YedZ